MYSTRGVWSIKGGISLLSLSRAKGSSGWIGLAVLPGRRLYKARLGRELEFTHHFILYAQPTLAPFLCVFTMALDRPACSITLRSLPDELMTFVWAAFLSWLLLQYETPTPKPNEPRSQNACQRRNGVCTYVRESEPTIHVPEHVFRRRRNVSNRENDSVVLPTLLVGLRIR